MAFLVIKLSKKSKHITQTNIKKCFPKLAESEQEKLVKKSMESAVMNFFELGQIWKKTTKTKDVIQNIYGVPEFEHALKQGKGLLLAVPHIGNWEALNLVLAEFDKYAFLYKPPSDKKVEEVLVKYRGKSKAKQIEANIKGVRQIMLHLKDKGFVTILPDQRPKSGQGMFSSFYEIPTYTMTLFSKLAVKTKAPVFFAYALRTEKGFDVYFDKSDNAIYTDLITSVNYLNKKIQSIVDKAPEQYQWTYKRFSIQPEGEPPFY